MPLDFWSAAVDGVFWEDMVSGEAEEESNGASLSFPESPGHMMTENKKMVRHKGSFYHWQISIVPLIFSNPVFLKIW
jgi:hypothetical protein